MHHRHIIAEKLFFCSTSVLFLVFMRVFCDQSCLLYYYINLRACIAIEADKDEMTGWGVCSCEPPGERLDFLL